MRFVFTIVLALLVFTGVSQSTADCGSAIDLMYSKWAGVKTMSYHSKKYERHLKEDSRAEFDFTIQRSPFKVAGKMSDKGHYILYDPQVSKTESAYISKGFPFTNLMLDIHGKLFRGLNHYTISDAGCEFIFGIIKKEFIRIPENFTCTKITRNGSEEILMRAETDNFRWLDYTALPGETVLDIADKLSVSAYLIIEKNDHVHTYTDDCGGKTIKVPSHYGRIMELYVSTKHGMPTRIVNYDDKGVFESYDYSDYRFNFALDPNYFTIDYLDDLD